MYLIFLAKIDCWKKSFRRKSAKFCQNDFTSLLFPPAMLIFRRTLWCTKHVGKINLCYFVPFRRQWREHYLKTRNKLNKIWGKNMKICPKNTHKMKTSFWCWKSETAKEKWKTRFFDCLAESPQRLFCSFIVRVYVFNGGLLYFL